MWLKVSHLTDYSFLLCCVVPESAWDKPNPQEMGLACVVEGKPFYWLFFPFVLCCTGIYMGQTQSKGDRLCSIFSLLLVLPLFFYVTYYITIQISRNTCSTEYNRYRCNTKATYWMTHSNGNQTTNCLFWFLLLCVIGCCTAGRVHVLCIYLHTWWEFPWAAQVFVTVFVWRLSITNQ